jgi:hypothetical protein
MFFAIVTYLARAGSTPKNQFGVVMYCCGWGHHKSGLAVPLILLRKSLPTNKETVTVKLLVPSHRVTPSTGLFRS